MRERQRRELARLPKTIRVKNFESYQHGGENTKWLPWVKLHVTTLVDVDLMALPAPTFKVFMCLLLLARKTDNRVPTECKRLARTMHLTSSVVESSVRELLREGFVEPFRVSTESRRSRDAVELRARAREEKKELPPKPPASGGLNGKALRGYTGCRVVRGTHGSSYVQDVLGRDKPPATWPFESPSRDQVRDALEKAASA